MYLFSFRLNFSCNGTITHHSVDEFQESGTGITDVFHLGNRNIHLLQKAFHCFRLEEKSKINVI